MMFLENVLVFVIALELLGGEAGIFDYSLNAMELTGCSYTLMFKEGLRLLVDFDSEHQNSN